MSKGRPPDQIPETEPKLGGSGGHWAPPDPCATPTAGTGDSSSGRARVPRGRHCPPTRAARARLPAPRNTRLSRAVGPGRQRPGGSPVSRCPALKGSGQARKAVITRQTQTDRRQDPAGNLLPKEKGASQQSRPREKGGGQRLRPGSVPGQGTDPPATTTTWCSQINKCF